MGHNLIDFHCLCAHKIGPFDILKSPPFEVLFEWRNNFSVSLKYMFSETVTKYLKHIPQTDSNNVHS